MNDPSLRRGSRRQAVNYPGVQAVSGPHPRILFVGLVFFGNVPLRFADH